MMKIKKSKFISNIINKFFKANNIPKQKLSIKITNNIPLGKGLGSSSAILVALNSLFLNDNLSLQELLDFVLNSESHSDNLTAAFFGGSTTSAIINKKIKFYKF